MTEYYFTRHGESEANVTHTFAGWTDVPLSEKGHLDAEEEGRRLADGGVSFDLILSSPLSRAYDTSAIIAKAVKYPIEDIVTLDELKERNAGRYEGMPTSTLDGQPSGGDPIGESGGETVGDFAGRVRSALERIRRESIGRVSVLVVAHAGWYKMASSLLEHTDITTFFMRPTPKNNNVVKFPL